MTGAELVRYLDALKLVRLPLESHVRQCYQFSHPIRGVQFAGGNDQSPESLQNQAAAMQAALFDGTATDAANVLASTLVSGMTPAHSRWGTITAGEDADSEVKNWLDKESTATHQGIHASNFDAPAFEAALDVVDAGWCALYIEEGDETDYIFEAWPLADCWFASTRKDGSVDTAARQYSLTAQQAAREYGEKVLPEQIREAVTKNPYQRFPFVHFIMPKQFDPEKKKSTKDELLPVASWHVCLTSKRIMRSKGYAEFPVAVPRWLKLPNSVYAQGPMSAALPDAKSLNDMRRIILTNAEWQMSGMWGAVNDGVLNMKTAKVGPRKVLFMESKESIWDLTPKGNINVGKEEAQEIRTSIRRIMMADHMESLNAQGSPRTAAEWHYRMNLLRSLLGPQYGRLQWEYLQTIFFRCFNIRLRKQAKAGKMPPPGLRGKQLRLKFVTPLARAQQLEDVAAMDRFEEGLLNKVKLRGNDSLDVYDWDAAERRRSELLGVPQTLVLDEKKMLKAREDRQAREQKAAAAAAAPAPGAMPGGGMGAGAMPAGMEQMMGGGNG